MTEAVRATIELQGRLIEDARMAQAAADSAGHFVPALCFEVESPATGIRCRVQQYFPVGHDKQCLMASYRLKRGALVSFQVDTSRLKFKAEGVSQVHLIEAPAKAAAPRQAEIAG